MFKGSNIPFIRKSIRDKAWKEVEPMCFKAKIDSIRRAQTPENVSRFFIDLNDIAHAEFNHVQKICEESYYNNMGGRAAGLVFTKIQAKDEPFPLNLTNQRKGPEQPLTPTVKGPHFPKFILKPMKEEFSKLKIQQIYFEHNLRFTKEILLSPLLLESIPNLLINKFNEISKGIFNSLPKTKMKIEAWNFETSTLLSDSSDTKRSFSLTNSNSGSQSTISHRGLPKREMSISSSDKEMSFIIHKEMQNVIEKNSNFLDEKSIKKKLYFSRPEHKKKQEEILYYYNNLLNSTNYNMPKQNLGYYYLNPIPEYDYYYPGFSNMKNDANNNPLIKNQSNGLPGDNNIKKSVVRPCPYPLFENNQKKKEEKKKEVEKNILKKIKSINYEKKGSTTKEIISKKQLKEASNTRTQVINELINRQKEFLKDSENSRRAISREKSPSKKLKEDECQSEAHATKLESQEKFQKNLKEIKDQKGHKEMKDLKDLKDLKELKELKEFQEFQEYQELKELKEQKELKEIKEPNENKEPKDIVELPSNKAQLFIPLYREKRGYLKTNNRQSKRESSLETNQSKNGNMNGINKKNRYNIIKRRARRDDENNVIVVRKLSFDSDEEEEDDLKSEGVKQKEMESPYYLN